MTKLSAQMFTATAITLLAAVAAAGGTADRAHLEQHVGGSRQVRADALADLVGEGCLIRASVVGSNDVYQLTDVGAALAAAT